MATTEEDSRPVSSVGSAGQEGDVTAPLCHNDETGEKRKGMSRGSATAANGLRIYSSGVVLVVALAVLVSGYKHLGNLQKEKVTRQFLSHPSYSRRELKELKQQHLNMITAIKFRDGEKVQLTMSLSGANKVVRKEFYEGTFYCFISGKGNSNEGVLRDQIERTLPTDLLSATFVLVGAAEDYGMCGYYRKKDFPGEGLMKVEQELLLAARLNHQPVVRKIWAHIWGSNESEHVTVVKSLLPSIPSHTDLLHHSPVERVTV